mmetsp:Transcript_25351/g.28203  ORF Transcript_25351/g.28203 Transcript_25351/m.28203 type:complete len:235 (-) Transcript_25351:27-731(-)
MLSFLRQGATSVNKSQRKETCRFTDNATKKAQSVKRFYCTNKFKDDIKNYTKTTTKEEGTQNESSDVKQAISNLSARVEELNYLLAERESSRLQARTRSYGWLGLVLILGGVNLVLAPLLFWSDGEFARSLTGITTSETKREKIYRNANVIPRHFYGKWVAENNNLDSFTISEGGGYDCAIGDQQFSGRIENWALDNTSFRYALLDEREISDVSVGLNGVTLTTNGAKYKRIDT